MWYIFYTIGNRDATFEYEKEEKYLSALGKLTSGGLARIISHGWREN